MSEETYAIKTQPTSFKAEIKCQICDDIIPIYYLGVAYPHICDECRKRLKKLLYGKSEGE